MSVNVTNELEKIGLYAGNVILELEPDVKGVKSKIKVNNLATPAEMERALTNFSYLCAEVHNFMLKSGLPVTYLLPKEEKPTKKIAPIVEHTIEEKDKTGK